MGEVLRGKEYFDLMDKVSARVDTWPKWKKGERTMTVFKETRNGQCPKCDTIMPAVKATINWSFGPMEVTCRPADKINKDNLATFKCQSCGHEYPVTLAIT